MLVVSIFLELFLVVLYPLLGVLNIVFCFLQVGMDVFAVFEVLKIIGEPVAVLVDGGLFCRLTFGLFWHACSPNDD